MNSNDAQKLADQIEKLIDAKVAEFAGRVNLVPTEQTRRKSDAPMAKHDLTQVLEGIDFKSK